MYYDEGCCGGSDSDCGGVLLLLPLMLVKLAELEFAVIVVVVAVVVAMVVEEQGWRGWWELPAGRAEGAPHITWRACVYPS